MAKKKVIIVGGGFGGLNAARKLGKSEELEITLIDQRNHHLFQPLLYQVAMAGLSPADIAAPIRALLAGQENTSVLKEKVIDVDLNNRQVRTTENHYPYDYLILACGSRHAYFGNNHWESFAPGLKTLEQATEIRRRVLNAFEEAEKEDDPKRQKELLTFVIVGGGPTGVELAGAVGEMSRFTLAKDFRRIDPKLTRIVLIEAGPRILPSFDKKLSSRAVRDLEKLGVQVWTSSPVTHLDKGEVHVGGERINCATILWAAGVKPSGLNQKLGEELDRQGRVVVKKDLSLPNHSNVFVIGDQAHFKNKAGNPLPGVAPVAMQQGNFVGQLILDEIAGKPRQEFTYRDKGQMATIGRSQAIVESGKLKFAGFPAWLAWLIVHIYYLTGFRNRIFVVMQWAWSYLTFRRGARLIVQKQWQFYPSESSDSSEK